MDRFLYRIYCKKIGKYIEGGCVKFGKVCFPDIEYCNDDDDECRAIIYPCEYQDWYVIEQCTGLKDKNGKLIYEGDVVVLGSSGFNYKIIWSDMECGWALQNLESKVCIAMNAFTADEIEIIGNIHEQKDNK